MESEGIRRSGEIKMPFILYEKNGQPVYVPPEIADLLRDLPPETENFTYDNDDLFKENDDEDIDEADEMEIDGRFDGVEVVAHDATTPKSVLQTPNHLHFLWSQLKNSGGKLVPFLKTLALYFLLFLPEDSPSWGAMGVKCLPILSLALFVLLHGVSHPQQHKFSRRILSGLLFSCVGDALLIWPDFFLHGMAAFGVAQIFYIRAFGFKPLNPQLGAFICILSSTVLLLIGPSVLSLEPPLVACGVFVYTSLLLTMVWRAASRFQLLLDTEPSASWDRGGGGGWSAICGLVGSMCFLVSDTVLVVNRYHTPIPHHQCVIMGTYFAAQLAIALSVLGPLPPTPSLSASPEQQHHLNN